MIHVIGGGPAGSFSAFCLKRRKADVTLVEEHAKAGLPVQCTGILTHNIHTLLEKENLKLPKKVIVNYIKQVRIFSPENNSLSVFFKNPDIILNRGDFDAWLFNKAQNSGADVLLNTRYKKTDFGKKKTSFVIQGKEKQVSCTHLIGADGPNSRVAFDFNLLKKRRYYASLQATVKIKHDNILDFYPYIGSFAWAVPSEDGHMRIGLCGFGKIKYLFDDLLKKYNGKVVSTLGGRIPLYTPYTKVQSTRNSISCALVGDAASQVKSTTGGGIIPGMCAAQLLSDCFDGKKFFGYQRKFLFSGHPRLYMHHILTNMMHKFSCKDWNNLVSDFQNKKLQHDLAVTPRDSPLQLLTKLFFHKPSLIKYAKHLF